MADDEKGTSSWYRVPTWSGNPMEWRAFKKEMNWWMASLDVESCKKYNVAARWALRQYGVVRARCEEFEPDELLGTEAVTMPDGASGDEAVVTPAAPFAGLKKLMRALEESVGKTQLDRRGELRSQFYQDMHRAPHERISAFCTRFRILASELKREGIDLPKSELGWFLKDRLGLDAIRKQLLDTALAGKEEYDAVEAEVLRLFRDLHNSDPLQKRVFEQKPLLQRFLNSSQQHGHGGRTSVPSSGSSHASTFRSFRSASSNSSAKPGGFSKPFQPASRQAMVAEGVEEDEPEEEELLPAADAEPAGPSSLEEVLQAEAEVLASELQQLEDEGAVEPQLLEELENGVEAAAESLVTMREARSRIAEVRKDRGFGKAGTGKGNFKPKLHGNQATAKKATTPHHCVREGHCGGPQGPVQAHGERAQGGPSEEIKRKQFQRNGGRAKRCEAEAQSQSSSSWNAKAWDGHHREASLREHPGHASSPGQPRRAIPSNAVASHAACDAHGKPSVSGVLWGAASTVRSRCDRRANGCKTIDPRGRAQHPDGGGRGPLCGELHEAAWSASRRGHSVERDRWVNPWKIHQELRPGLSQQISQAWERHERDRRLVSKSAKEVEAAMDFEWESNMMDFMNETFLTTIDLAHPQLREPLVQEVFTATQRVTLEAQKRGHLTGDPLSLETGWDFMKALDRRAAYAKVKKEKPYFLVLAYPCGPWSPLQRLNPAADLPEKREAHRDLIRFALSLARLQLRNGRHFILENPLGSESWTLPEIIKFLEEEEAKLARFDQCRFNLRSEQGWLHKKATQVATSSESVHTHLDQVRCTGDHPHQPVIGGSKITARAGHYPGQLAKTLVKAMEEEFERQFAVQPKEALAMEDGGGEEEEEPMAPGVDVPSSSEDGQPDGLEKVAISPAVKQAVKRLHENTGHRSNKRLARALSLTGAPPEVIRAARLHKCSVCQEMRAPKASRPASLPTPKDVSDQLAEVLPDKSSKSVTTFLKKRWFPIFGTPRVLIADQGREFVSWEFEQLCAENSILLWHCAVQAPWQNGLCERGGGVIKAILNSIIKSQSVMGKDDMDLALQEAITAYNGDVNELGVSPAQAAMGRQPRIQGDVLGDFGQRVGLVDSRPSQARQVAMRETARVAMARLHFSRGLRKALLSRSRNTTVTQPLEPGSIVYYFRQTKYNNKASQSKEKLSLRRWHGPALLVANEGTTNCFLSHKGQLTKCAREHVRLASTMEEIAAETWRDAIDEVVEAAMHDQARRQQQQVSAPDHADEAAPEAAQPDPAILEAPAQPQQQAPPAPADLPPVGPQEFAQAIRPADDAGTAVPTMASSVPQSVASSRRPMRSRSPVPDAVLRAGLMRSPTTAPVAIAPATTAAPKTPSAPATPRLSRAVERAQELTSEPLAGKREAEMTLDELARTLPSRSSASASTSGPAKPHDALVLSREEVEEVQTALQQDDLHPLRRLFLEAATEEANPMGFEFEDRGTWKGSWPLPSRSQLRAMKAVGAMLPRGEQEAMAVQTARKEYKWRDMTPEAKAEFREAAWKGWQTWVDNDAVEVLRPEEAKRVRENLRQTNKSHLILRPRYVYTDKNDGLRTEERQLPLKASARLVVPGYKDVSAYEVRKDAPTASRTSVHLLLVFTASKGWHLLSADVKAALISQRWYLRLHKSLEALGWKRSSIDSALWMLCSPTGECEGMICSHVDDLLFGGNDRAKELLLKLGEELGYGSLEEKCFHYCGKLIKQHDDGSISISMEEYHSNLKPLVIGEGRRKTPEASLTPAEHKQLRALLGSLQWLVAQVRFDQGFQLCTLQGESPTIGTMIRANALLRRFKQTPKFALWFRPMNVDGCGLMGVSDASLCNVQRSGAAGEDPMLKVYSQSAYIILIADKELMAGRPGKFAVLDARSHRLTRVCRSTYAAELLGVEECFDVGIYLRGCVAEAFGYPMDGRDVTASLSQVPLTVVTDAKDVYDKGCSDTPSYGSQKSLAFTVSWLRSILRQPSTNLRWTATQNMIVDAMTKDMDVTHLHQILEKGEWCVKFNQDFVKQTAKAPKNKAVAEDVKVGKPMSPEDPLLSRLTTLSESPGWHLTDGVVVHVARNARAFRTPKPRHDPDEYSIRSSYGRFDLKDGRSEWRQLECNVSYVDLPYSCSGLIGQTASVLVTFFRMPSHFNKRNGSTVEDGISHG
eukprot:s994_g16.t1